MTTYFWVGIGGAIGACARYALTMASARTFSSAFPWGTLTVNLLGCLLFGVVAGLAVSRGVPGPAARVFLLTGVLGGFTTYSSFAFESVELLRAGSAMAGVANVGAHLVLGTLAVWIGLLLTR